MLDTPDVIMRKFRRAITDSETQVRYDEENKPGISNLMNIYAAVTGKTFEEIEQEFDGKGYGDFKKAVGEAVVEALNPIQQRYNDLMKNKDYLNELMKQGAERAARIAYRTLNKVYRKVGLYNPNR